MSMLAERKRKQKWSLNPRGKAWSQDTNKFGQKLLEKMGWSEGKGLGAKEDGRTEHIKVSYKNDSQGVGYKETNDQWTEHQSNFSALLASLGGGEEQSPEIKLSSLEKKSENSKARVHYRKFTRGKDLSRYSEKDLANIFGKKSLKDINKPKKEVEVIEETKEYTEQDKNFSNSGLISDYFKKKLPNFGSTNGYVIGNNGVLRKVDDLESKSEQMPDVPNDFNQNTENNLIMHESESESEIRPSFGFGFKQEKAIFEKKSISEKNIPQNTETRVKSSFVSYVYENNVGDQISHKKKKNKKKRDIEDAPIDIESTPSKKKKLDLKDLPEESSIKKKKDKTKKKIKEDTGLSNPAFDPLYSPTVIEKHILEPLEETIDESFNRTLNDTVGQVAEHFKVQVQIVNEVTPVKRNEQSCDENTPKKRRSKKDKSNGMDLSIQDEESSLNSTNEGHGLQKKIKKKSKEIEAVQGMDTSCINESVENTSADITNGISKKEKKKKKSTMNSIETNTIISNDMETQHVISQKKKSKSKECKEGVDNPFFNNSMENNNSIAEVENPYEIKVKAKKKKSKCKKKEDFGVDNPVFNGEDSINVHDHINEKYEVKSKETNKENFGIENPVFNREDSINSNDLMNEEYEIKRMHKSKKKKEKEKVDNQGIDNPALNLNDNIEESCDLMLNVVATPVQIKPNNSVSDDAASIQKVKGVIRRKSVRFSDVTRERIIPNKEEMENETLDASRDIIEVQGKLNDSSDMTFIDRFIQKKKAKKRNKGLDNGAFDQQANNIEENLNSISKTLDTFQAEIENDINEAKLKSVEVNDLMVGEVGNPDGPNEKLPDGTVKLKFRHAKFKRTAKYIENLTGPKRSYKHLIKGDIVMHFKNTNLHEIDGYAVTELS